MRVMIARGEEKGEDPPFPPIQSPSDAGDGQGGAGVTPSQQAVPSSASAGENADLQDGRAPAGTSPREATSVEIETDTTNGKQRASAPVVNSSVSRAESSSDEVHLDVKEESDQTGQCHRTSAEVDQRTPRRGAAGADTSLESGLM